MRVIISVFTALALSGCAMRTVRCECVCPRPVDPTSSVIYSPAPKVTQENDLRENDPPTDRFPLPQNWVTCPEGYTTLTTLSIPPQAWCEKSR